MTRRLVNAYAMLVAIIFCRKEIWHNFWDKVIMNDLIMAVAVGAGAYAMAQMTSMALTGKWM